MDPVTSGQLPGVPRGYPAEYQQRVRLHDGRGVLIRPVLPGDGPGLAEAISRTYLADNSPVAALVKAADSPERQVVTWHDISEFTVALFLTAAGFPGTPGIAGHGHHLLDNRRAESAMLIATRTRLVRK